MTNFNEFLNQKVLLEFDGRRSIGNLDFVGQSLLHQHFNAAITTFTVGRTPIWIPNDRLDEVKISLFVPFSLFN